MAIFSCANIALNERYLTSTCTDRFLSNKSPPSSGLKYVRKENAQFTQAGRDRQTGGAGQVSARSAITGAMNRVCVETADSSEMSATQITVAVCHNPNARWTRQNRPESLTSFITSTQICGSRNSCQVPWHVTLSFPAWFTPINYTNTFLPTLFSNAISFFQSKMCNTIKYIYTPRTFWK
jgi:hypothetical protein